MEDDSCYKITDRLDINNVTKPICHHSHFSSTGLIKRPLSFSELTSLWHIPFWLRMTLVEGWEKRVLPCQIIFHLLAWYGREISPAALVESTGISNSKILYKRETDSSILSLLNKSLSHAWVLTQAISIDATKNDDTEVPTAMWDKRITLVFPSSKESLDILRNFVLRWQRHRLTREFLAFLRTHYGTDWVLVLRRYRRYQKNTGPKYKFSHQGGWF